MKKNLAFLVLLVALPPALLDFWYFLATSVDIPFQTSFFFMENLIKFYNNTLTFRDITAPYGEHRVIGCNIIFIINAIAFGLNTHIENYIFYFVYCFLGFFLIKFIYVSFIKTNIINTISILILIFAIFLTSAINFTLTQHYDTGMGVQVILSLLFSFLFLVLCNRLLLEGVTKGSLLSLVVLEVFTFLVFGTGYTYDAALAVLLCVAMRCFVNRRIDLRSLIVIIATIAGCLIYLKMPYAYPLSGTGGLGARLLSMFEHPVKTINFFLVSLGASIIGQRPFSDSLSGLGLYEGLGGAVSVLYAVGIVSAHRYRHLIKSYLPELLIYYSIFNIAIVCLGRWSYIDDAGDWGVSAWYIYHNKLGLIGVIWIFLVLTTHCIKGDLKIFTSAWAAGVFFMPLLVIILVPLCWIELHIVKIVPAIRNFTERTVYYAYFPEDTPTDANGITPFLWNLPELKRYLGVMRDHKIGPYRPTTHWSEGDNDGVVIAGERYPDGWVGKSIGLMLSTGERGELFITSFVPSSLFPNGNGFRVLLDGRELYHGFSEPDKLTAHVVKVPDNIKIGIKIIPDNTLSPHSAQINDDLRELSFKLGEFFTR